MINTDRIDEILIIVARHPGRSTQEYLRIGFTSAELAYIKERPELARTEFVPGGMHGGTYRNDRTYYYPVH